VDILWQELGAGLPDARQLAVILIRVLAAALLGALVGFQRERSGKAAGLRTHMLVCLGTATIVLAGVQAGMAMDALSRVIQGVVTGIGFIGAGTILKRSDEAHIEGLTTAASVWLTAAIGVSVGLGSLAVGVLGALLAWVVLAFRGDMKGRNGRPGDQGGQDPA
jgi:putative Mg2+ transporter-C (MgtC) family protein